MEYLEVTKDFDGYALPDVLPFDAGDTSSNKKVNESVALV